MEGLGGGLGLAGSNSKSAAKSGVELERLNC